MRNLSSRFLKLFLTCGGLGLSPKAPGTITSVGATLFWFPFLFGYQWLIFVLCVFLTVISGPLVRLYERQMGGGHDRQEITMDEWIGVGLAMCAVNQPNWIWAIAAFGLFRLFDIWKPIGVRYFDRTYLNGYGVILDDVVAGIYAAVILVALQKII